MREKSSRETELFCLRTVPQVRRNTDPKMKDANRPLGSQEQDDEPKARIGGLDPNASISRKLRDYYGSLQEERIPDRFLDLLERLDEAERKAGSAGKT